MIRLAALLSAVLLLVSCGGRAGGERDVSSDTHALSPVVRACPLGVPETRVELRDTEDGVSIAFMTTPERVADLRRRVAAQAERHGPEAHKGPGHDGWHGTSHAHGLRLWALPPVKTSVEELGDGARMVITPVDPAALADVRDKLRDRVRHLEDKDCP